MFIKMFIFYLINSQDIVRGRLGLNGPNGRRDSSAQITTIETSGKWGPS